ncbi:MAG: hypothetical protein ABIK59_03945 [candidate division WOR-3 bacterium]
MRCFFLILLPLFVFSYYDFSLRKEAEVSELTEDPYTDYYLNPAAISELKERFIGSGIYSDKKTQFAFLNFFNPNKLLSYGLTFANLETEFSSEKSLTFFFSQKKKDYSYGFKFQVGEIKNLYEESFSYENSEFDLQKEGPVGDSSSTNFYLEDYYLLEERRYQYFNHYQNKSNLFLFPLAFYLKFKELEVGIDLQNFVEKRIDGKVYEERNLEIEEEYEYRKEGDTLLRELEEYLTSDIRWEDYLFQKIDSLKVWYKDISLFLRKRTKGIKEKKIFFTRLGYSSEIIKGNTYQKNFNNSYEASLEWERSYEDGYWYCESLFFEESNSVKNETKRITNGKKENLYQEGGFGFNYLFSFLRLDNTIFLGIKEKVDLIRGEKEWEKKGKIYFYLGNNLEIANLSFFPIFLPYLTIEENKNKLEISYDYKIFFDLKFKMFDFLTSRFSYLLPSEKDAAKRWVLSFYLNY